MSETEAEAKRRREKRIRRRQLRSHKARAVEREKEARKLQRAFDDEKEWHQKEMAREQNFATFKPDPGCRSEHPSTRGYALVPLREDWNAAVCSPVYFGYLSQYKGGDSFVRTYFRVFGVRADTFCEKVQAALVASVRSAILEISNDIKEREFTVRVASVEGLDTTGETFRRLRRKLELRADKSKGPLSAIFKGHSEALDAGGAVTAEIVIPVTLMETIFDERGHPNPCRRDAPIPDPIVDATFGVQGREAAMCERICGALAKSVTRGEMTLKVKRHIGDEPKLSVALLHLPSTNCHGVVNDYKVACDTPRERKTAARRLLHGTLSTIASNAPPRSGFGPRYEAVKFVHPTFFNRSFRHNYPRTPEKSSPVFWGQMERVLVKDEANENPTRAHPACAGLLVGATGHAIAEDMDARATSPVFWCHKILNRTKAKPKQVIAAQGALIVSRRSRNERIMSTRNNRNRNNAALAFAVSDRAERRAVSSAKASGSDVHPSTMGYCEVSNWKNDARMTHASRFGYPDDEPTLPLRAICEIVHPSCVGFELSREDASLRREACKYMSPIFFGYRQHRGPRYEPPVKSRWHVEDIKVEVKTSHSRFNGENCHLCFGFRTPGCPKCWSLGKKADETAAKTFRRRQTAASLTAFSRKMSYLDTNVSAAAMHTPFLSAGHIAEHRETTASIVTVYIKKLPLGTTVRLQVENTRTLRYLFFLYRSNAPPTLAHQSTMYLLLPTRPAVFLLQDGATLDGDYRLGEQPGMFTLADYNLGVTTRKSEVIMFQVPDLHHPDAENLIRAYITQNVDLNRTHGERALSHEEFLIAKEMPTIKAFGYGDGVLHRNAMMPSCKIQEELDDLSNPDRDDIQKLLVANIREAYDTEKETKRMDAISIAQENRKRIQMAVDERLKKRLARRKAVTAKKRSAKGARGTREESSRTTKPPMRVSLGIRPPPLDIPKAQIRRSSTVPTYLPSLVEDKDKGGANESSEEDKKSVPQKKNMLRRTTTMITGALRLKRKKSSLLSPSLTRKLSIVRSPLGEKIVDGIKRKQSISSFFGRKASPKSQLKRKTESKDFNDEGAGGEGEYDDGKSPTSMTSSSDESVEEYVPNLGGKKNDILMHSIKAVEKRMERRKLIAQANIRRQKSLAQASYAERIRQRKSMALMRAGASSL